MKKPISIMLFTALFLSLAACSESESNREIREIEPQISQMKSICELATMECYYHNVAKYFEEDASGVLWWKKDRKFWVEYSGIVTIGIDTSLVTMEIDGDTVSITIPPARVFRCKVDENTLSKDSFIIAQNSAEVEAEHQTEAFRDAQAKMREAAENDTALLANAQLRAQKLLEDYVRNIGEIIGKTYTVKWIHMDDSTESDKNNTESVNEIENL